MASYRDFLAEMSGTDPMLDDDGDDEMSGEDLLEAIAGIDPMIGAITLPKTSLLKNLTSTARNIAKLPAASQQSLLKQSQQLAARQQMAQLQAQARNFNLARQRQSSKVEDRAHVGKQPSTFLGVQQLAVAAGATVAIPVNPASHVRLIDFTVDPTNAAAFLITSIMFGRLNLLQGAFAIPATMFLPNSNRPPFEAPRIYPGQPITVNVTNRTAAVADFNGGFYCVDLDIQV